MRNSIATTLAASVISLGIGYPSKARAANPLPREPLTFADSGLYGGWDEYLVSAESPFNFLIIQAVPFVGSEQMHWHGRPEDDTVSWNDWLLRARNNGKRVIADLGAAITTGQDELQTLQSLYGHDNAVSFDALKPAIDKFFDEVDESQLYAITISEEHVHWNGQADVLNECYDYIKSKYDVPIYQWYTPNAPAPGFGYFPNLRSDGWMSDEYYLDRPAFDVFMRVNLIQRKPVMHIVWAAPDMPSVPYVERTFQDQMAVCKQYDIPVAYFTWTGDKNVWGWTESAPEATRDMFERYCMAAADFNRAHHADVDHRMWDFVPQAPPWLTLQCDPEGRPRMAYRDDFAQVSHVRFLNDAQVDGFAHLKWDSSPLQLSARSAGEAEAKLTWRFNSPLPMSKLRVSVPVRSIANASGTVEVQVTDADGSLLAKGKSTNGVIELTMEKPRSQRFIILCTLRGTASAADQALVEIDGIDVQADIAATSNPKPIHLHADSAGVIEYEDDFSNLTILHTARDIVRRTNHTLKPGWIYSGGLQHIDAFVWIVQRFESNEPLKLSRLWVGGKGNMPEDHSRFGVGISLDGVNIITETWSEGKYDGIVRLDLPEIDALKSGVTMFYVHLKLEANSYTDSPETVGVRGYGLEGTVLRGE